MPKIRNGAKALVVGNVVTLDKFLRGLSQYIGGCYDYVTENGSLDAGQIDAEGADCIIQFALFGDIIYG